MKSILLVGEQNPHGSDPTMALYPLPENGSGGRLQRILGLSRGEYLRVADRANLCYDAWDELEARNNALVILSQRPKGSGLVLLGRKAERAFGYVGPRYEARLIETGHWLLALPHPSGLCREWNDQQNVERARAAFADLAQRLHVSYSPAEAREETLFDE